MAGTFALFAGTANAALAAAVARDLAVGLSDCAVERFPDGELTVRLLEPVRGKEVFLLQPTGPPVNDHLIELLAFADACLRAAAARITAVVPYFGYARADRRGGRREPITASLVADLLQAAGVQHVVTVDLHTPQAEGFFHCPVDSLTAVSTLCAALRDWPARDAVVVAPDAGRVPMATRYAQRLGTDLAVLHKRRLSGTETVVTHLVGDVRDRRCLLVDDIVATGGTIATSAATLREARARPELVVVATHGLLLPGARDRLGRAGVQEVVVTDTVAVPERDWPALRVVSVAPLLAAALRRFLADESLSDLY